MTALPVWIVVALLGHIANGAAFVIDKTLLRKSFKRSATYSGLIGLLGMFAVVLIPFGVTIPSEVGWLWIVISGATFIFALWLFFEALKHGEATRVVPVVGSLIPILTLVGTTLFLGERLGTLELTGFAALVIATVILSGAGSKAHGKLTLNVILNAVASSMLFATSFVTVKLAYEAEGFLTAFTFSRFVGVIAAIIILAIDAGAFQEIRNAILPRKKSGKQMRGERLALLLVVAAQSLGAGGFVLIQYAISLGSASLVNALQAVQYVFLVLVAFVFAKKAPDLLGENLTTIVVIRKLIAIVFVALGLWLVV